MTEKKITKKEQFIRLLAIEEVASNEQLVAFINHEIEQLDKKSKGGDKPSEHTLANEQLKKEILAGIAQTGKVTITEFQEKVASMKPYSNQKLNALFRQLVNDSKLVRIKEKQKSYFTIAEDVTDANI